MTWRNMRYFKSEEGIRAMKTIRDSLCPRGVEVLVRKPDVADNDNGKGSMAYNTASEQDKVGHAPSLV